MTDRLPGIVQRPFDLVGETLGPGAALYRDGLERFKHYHGWIESRLAPWQQRVDALQGTPEDIRRKAAVLYADMERERERLYRENPPPPAPFEDPRITQEDRRLYHLLETRVLEKGRKTLPDVLRLAETLEAWASDIAAKTEEEITSEQAKKEARDRRAERRQRKRKYRSKIAGYVVNITSTVLSSIPNWITQVAGAVIAIGGSVGQAVYDLDTARRYAHAIRNNANWLVYEYPHAATRLDNAIQSADFAVGVQDLAASLQEGVALRLALNKIKEEKKEYDERKLLDHRMDGWQRIAVYAGIGLAALALLRRTLVR